VFPFKKRKSHQKDRYCPRPTYLKAPLSKIRQGPFNLRSLHLNTSYMHFCGLSYDEVAATNREGKKVIDSSTLTKIRARL
jgi:hypothetical protein